MVNGKDYSTYINSCTTEGGTAGCDSWSRFRDISSRIMWNFPDTDYLKLDYAHGTFNADDASVGNADMKAGTCSARSWARASCSPAASSCRTAR